jgi:hypothetical protein
LLACEWYEYARESRAVIREITAERKRIKQRKEKHGQTKFGPRVQNAMQSLILLYLTITDGFPDVPWKSLSAMDRVKFLRMVIGFPHTLRYLQTWNNPPLLFSMNEPGTMALDSGRKQCQERLPTILASDPIKSGFFSVNMKYSRRVLIEEFAKWLTNFEGKPMFDTPSIEKELSAPKKLPGRKSIYDKLNALAVLRLRYHCATFSEAKRKMEALKNKPHGMFYERADNASRACNLALRNFQNLFGWLDSAKPIHFTEGWRGGTQKTKCISEDTQK